MTRVLQEWWVPVLLFACLIFGGSSQGIWTNAVLQLVAIGMFYLAMSRKWDKERAADVAPIGWLGFFLVALAVAQLVPLPHAIWTSLPGRSVIAEGDRLLGLGNLWRPVSLAPSVTGQAILGFIPAFAMFALVVGKGSQAGPKIVAALALALTLALTLATVQRLGGVGQFDGYFYPRSNTGVATGFFANGNHMAALLLCSIPYAAALYQQKAADGQDASWRASKMLAVSLAGIGLVGIAINGSLFGLLMAIPVAIASAFVAFKRSLRINGRFLLIGMGSIAIMGVVAMSLAGGLDKLGFSASTSVASRAEINTTSLDLAAHYFPVGSGLGTFESVYALTENPDKVDLFFVNHAHNDYLEWGVETGVPGLILLVAFLLWFGRTFLIMLKDRTATGYAQAGGITAIILMLHSVVDFPLRTAALSSLFAMSIGLMIASRGLPERRKDLRPVRHVVID